MAARTIVVVEEKADIAGSIAARLRSEGFRVEVAGTGPDGVALARTLAPDLVVLDWMLLAAVTRGRDARARRSPTRRGSHRGSTPPR